MGGSRYDVFAGEEKIGSLEHAFKQSLLRSTWIVARPRTSEDVATAQERTPGDGDPPSRDRLRARHRREDSRSLTTSTSWSAAKDRRMDRKFQLRDRYVLDLSGDTDRKLDRRLAVALAIGLDTLQNR